MSESTPTPTPSTTPPGDGGTAGGTQAPEGFVPLADLEREQARARSFQSELDRAKSELAARPTPAPTTTTVETTPTTPGFDPVEFRRSLLTDASNVMQMTQAVVDLKSRFPHADAAIYSRLAEFGNPDALRLAIEDSHNRVASAIATEVEAVEARLREEYGTKIGGNTPPGNAPIAQAGDPSVEQLRAMTGPELHAFDKANPGVVERVLSSTT